ncbi:MULTISPECIES: sensor histidine kinase [Olivibacter]|uniref:Sensor histidine kinase n=1 Tax=Olivibacter jilunii TaxID=985016 RepID=A0ABW6B3I1_9SPHI|nr:histidine kinase [Pseudosphingobacterium sp.]
MVQLTQFKLSPGQQKLLGIQVACWLLYFGIVYIGTRLNFPQQRVGTLIGIFVLKVIVFYLLLGILFLVFNKKHWYKGLLLLLIFYFLAAPGAYLYLYKLMVHLGFKVNQKVPPLDWSFLGRMAKHYILLVIFAVGLFVFLKYRAYKNKQIEMAIIEYKTKMYAALMAKELEKLKYDVLAKQADPHFVHNIFNLFFGELLKYSPRWAQLMASFSGLTRYTFTHASQGTRKIVVSKEWQQVEAALALQQARFPEIPILKPEVQGAFAGQRVLPMAFITPLENAFKYGDFTGDGDALYIKLLLTDDLVEFTCRNRFDRRSRPITSSGTGLSNLRRRLEIVFKNEFQLTVSEEEAYFTVKISINQ